MLETIISAIIGITAALILSVIFSLKTRGIMRVLINAAAGVAVLLILQFFKLSGFALNPLSAFLCGFLGLPGVLVIFIVTNFL